MNLSVTDGIKNTLGGLKDTLVSGPLRAASGTVQTALGAVTLPIRLPLSVAGSIFGRGGSPQARAGAQEAFLNYN